MFVDLAEFPCFYLLWTKNCFVSISRTIFCSHQVNSGKNREIQLNQKTIIRQVLTWLKKIWSCILFIKLYTSIICKNLPVCLTSFDFFLFSIIPVCLVSFDFFWFSIIALSLFTSCSFFESLCWAVLATIFNESMVDWSCFVMPSGSEWFRWDSWTFWKSSFNCP